jgi:hypothetical protein
MTLPLFPSAELAERPHTCHARDCETPVPPEMLMCFAHWRLVPRVIQRAVWAAYRVGQCDDKRPSEARHRAADAAIGAVARKEGKPLRPQETASMIEFGLLPPER